MSRPGHVPWFNAIALPLLATQEWLSWISVQEKTHGWNSKLSARMTGEGNELKCLTSSIDGRFAKEAVSC